MQSFKYETFGVSPYPLEYSGVIKPHSTPAPLADILVWFYNLRDTLSLLTILGNLFYGSCRVKLISILYKNVQECFLIWENPVKLCDSLPYTFFLRCVAVRTTRHPNLPYIY